MPCSARRVCYVLSVISFLQVILNATLAIGFCVNNVSVSVIPMEMLMRWRPCIATSVVDFFILPIVMPCT